MKISTRGRYGLRLLAELALHQPDYADGSCVSLKDIARHQDVSVKYLEQIVPVLVSAGFIEAVQGKRGGYRLAVRPDLISVGDVLRLTEGSLAPVACLDCGAQVCPRSGFCSTLPMWRDFEKLIADFFDSRTIADLIPDPVM